MRPRDTIIVLAALTTAIGCEPATADDPTETRGAWLGPEARGQWLITELEQQNAGLSVEARSAKYCKMAQTPFVFFRGSNHLFWHDLADDPRFEDFGGEPETRIWLLGDLHPLNYGAFDNDDGLVVYDLNDFDEVVIGDYQWDLWRMAAGLALLAEEQGFSTGETEDFLDDFTEHYLDAMAGFRGNDGELGFAATAASSYGLLDDFLDDVESSESRLEMLEDWTVLQGGVRVFDMQNPDLAAVDPAIVAQIQQAWPAYVATTAGGLAADPDYFTIKDIAAVLNVGTGSLGVPRYYVLIEGPGPGQNNDRILDLKRQGEPTGYGWLDAEAQALLDGAVANHAERTLAGYRALVSDADDHLGWLSLADGNYSLRARSPYKKAFPVADLDTVVRFSKLAEQWGTILAADHARADKDHRPEVIAHSIDKQIDLRTDGEHAAFRALVREVALDYRDQVVLDYGAFSAWWGQQQSCP
ncbi:MAG: DUF2252 family protein [Myxococcales bacterium]|nr:DUF2252 family protein [Myxococcales bacterium]